MAQAINASKPRRIALWSLSILLGLAFMLSGIGTLSGGMDAVLNGQLGVPLWALPIIGAIKVGSAIAIVIPVSRFYGATMLTATMAGAVLTHVMAQDPAGLVAPLVLGALAGTVAWFTRPDWVQERIGVPA